MNIVSVAKVIKKKTPPPNCFWKKLKIIHILRGIFHPLSNSRKKSQDLFQKSLNLFSTRRREISTRRREIFRYLFKLCTRDILAPFSWRHENGRTAGIKKVKGCLNQHHTPFTLYIYFQSFTDRCRDGMESPTLHCLRGKR